MIPEAMIVLAYHIQGLVESILACCGKVPQTFPVCERCTSKCYVHGIVKGVLHDRGQEDLGAAVAQRHGMPDLLTVICLGLPIPKG